MLNVQFAVKKKILLMIACGEIMKLHIKISYEWEEDVTEMLQEWLEDGYTIEEFKQQELSLHHAIDRLDTAADNHILSNYKRELEQEWIE